jgi:hypothetical protein
VWLGTSGHAEGRRHNHKEVAGYDPLGVIAHEGHPTPQRTGHGNNFAKRCPEITHTDT